MRCRFAGARNDSLRASTRFLFSAALLLVLPLPPLVAAMADNSQPMLVSDPSYALRYKVRMGETGGVKNLIKEGNADILAGGGTVRKWTPLHIACWGTNKPQNDKDIVEALLLWAQKAGKEADIRGATDNSPEACTPADLAKIRRELVAALPGTEEGAAMEEKRKYDKIVEWLEKGLPAA